ncbi:MAG: hypothetical protein RPU60_12895 [Candidatus Sedimenticola sp. (ex Thyasira tokunagai)]
MSNDLRTAVTIDLQGNLVRKAARYEKSMKRFSNNSRRHMGRMSKTAAATGRMLDRAGNRYTALLTGAAGAGTMRMLVGLETRFTRLGIQANKDTEEMDALKRQIYDVASAPNISIDPGQLTSAIEEIVEKTGDLDFARENIDNLAIAISATGAQGGAIGGIAAEFQKMGITSKGDVREALDILTVQGKEGAFTLQNLAQLGSRVVTAYTSMGRTGVPAIREMGAALQVVRQGTGNADQAATAYEAVLRTLSDAKKVKMLEKGGIKIFEDDGKTMRSLPTLMEEIVAAAKGKKTVLSKVFEAESIRAFNSAITEFNQSGNITSLQRFLDVQADGSTVLDDSARAAETAEAAMRNLYTIWQQFADNQLTDDIKEMSKWLKSVDKDTLETWLKVGVYGAGGLIGMSVLGKGGRLIKGAAGVLGKKKGVAGALGGLAGGVTPVYVVNLPGAGMDGLMSGKAGKASKAGRTAKIFSKAKTTAGLLSATPLSKLRLFGAGALGTAAAGVTAAGAAGYGVGTLAYDHAIAGTDLADKIGESVARALAFFGNQEAKLAIEINDKRAEVKSLETKGFEADVDTGAVMVGP